jgi:hypothetical protein
MISQIKIQHIACLLIDVLLCASKTNFISKIGSLTGYQVKYPTWDLRGKGLSFQDALKEAFKRTGLPMEVFEAVEWGKDSNGKTGVVRWKGPKNSEVNNE